MRFKDELKRTEDLLREIDKDLESSGRFLFWAPIFVISLIVVVLVLPFFFWK